MVLLLAGTLDVPLRERNQLLLAAGYAPIYRETGIAEPAMPQVRSALERVLRYHEPFPAVVMDRHWNLMLTNAAAASMFAWLLGNGPSAGPPNVLRLMFDPGGLRPYVANWEQVGEALIQRVHREAVGGVPDAETARSWGRCSGCPASLTVGARRTSPPPRRRSCRSSSARGTLVSATSRW